MKSVANTSYAEVAVPLHVYQTFTYRLNAEQSMEAKAGSRLVVLANAGHVSNLERTEPFNQALQDFLKELPN